MKQAYPLQWPVGYPRTNYPKKSAFKNPMLGRAVSNILNEINRLNDKFPGWQDPSVVISSDVPLRNDGFPRADYYRSGLRDKGVAVYFETDGKEMVLCCDKWDTVESNLHAIYKTIEALRAIDRWGVSDFINRSFTGFKALGDGSAPATAEWYKVLLFDTPPSNFEVIGKAYKELAKKYHPDLPGGSHQKMQILNSAYNEAKNHYGV